MPIPAKGQPLWRSIQQEVILLHFVWNNYRTAFAVSSDQIEVLNRCDAQFFYVVQMAILTEVQMGLARLADTGKRNATVETLVGKFAAITPNCPKKKWTKAVNAFRSKVKLIKHRRDKRIAHLDLGTLLQQHGHLPKTDMVDGPSRQEIGDALLSLRDFMNLVEGYYDPGTTTAYDIVFESGKGLMRILNEYIQGADAKR